MEPAGFKDRNNLPPTGTVCESTMNENNVLHGLLLRLCLINGDESAGNHQASGKQIFYDLHCHLSPDIIVYLLVDFDLLTSNKAVHSCGKDAVSPVLCFLDILEYFHCSLRSTTRTGWVSAGCHSARSNRVVVERTHRRTVIRPNLTDCLDNGENLV